MSICLMFYLPVSSVQSLSCVRLFATPWIAACQASLSITNSRVYSDSCPLSQRCNLRFFPLCQYVYHVRIECRIQHAWGWCTGMTQRDVVGREVGGGFMFGIACTPVVD
ncbi:hypothetical protein R6Z07F_010093 [Ovis aries]